MGRIIALTGKSENGQDYAKPRVIYVNEENVKVYPGKNGTKIREYQPDGAYKSFQVYERAEQIEAARNPSSSDIYTKNHVSLNVAAAGATQGAATALTTYLNEIGSATAATTDGVKLPAATVGKTAVIINTTAVVLDVWPNTGDKIDALAVNANSTLAAKTRAHYVCKTAGVWTTAEDKGN